MNGKGNRQFRLSGSQSILLGFLAMILAGTLLLMLPISTRTGEWTGFTNAFVTGLVLYDTASHWSIFGQVVILTMIQIGGMGVVTMTTILSRLIGKKISLQARTTLQEAVSAPNLGEILKYTRFICIGTVIFEAAGAVAMSPVFISEYGIFKGIWVSVFSSISVTDPKTSVRGYFGLSDCHTGIGAPQKRVREIDHSRAPSNHLPKRPSLMCSGVHVIV